VDHFGLRRWIQLYDAPPRPSVPEWIERLMVGYFQP
jgi:hypothetical protein